MIDFGLTPKEFIHRCVEREVYLKRQAVRERPFDWHDLDELLWQIEPTPALLQLFNQGMVPQDTYTEDTVDLGLRRRRLNKARFYAQMKSGATLVLNRLELHSSVAKQACAEIARFTNQQTLSNAYVSFGGAGTFGRHWDTHDVFALQFIGRKRWQVFKPTFPFPLNTQGSTNAPVPQTDAPVLDCVLEPGDLLYIPRGWWHQVLPFEEGSLHLSVGGYLPTVHDYIAWACSRFLPQYLAARKGIGGAASMSDDLASALQFLAQTAGSQAHLQEFLATLATRERVVSKFDVALILDPNSAGLSPLAEVSLTSFQPMSESGELTLNGARILLDQTSRQIVRLLAGGPQTLAHLCEQLPAHPHATLRDRVVELAKHDVVSIREQPTLTRASL